MASLSHSSLPSGPGTLARREPTRTVAGIGALSSTTLMVPPAQNS